jgi:hypothetical protein
VDEPFRGVVERGYADWIYLARVLNLQLGGLDVLLRGEGVYTALRPVPGGAGPEVGLLVGDGIGVIVDDHDLRESGFSEDDLIPGITVRTADHRVADWTDYAAVWFL